MAILTGLLGTILGTVLIGGALLGAWMLGRERGRREIRAGDSALPHPVTRAAIDRLEQDHEALRAELERLSEDQRFAMRLLADKTPASHRPADADLAGPGVPMPAPPVAGSSAEEVGRRAPQE